MIQIFQSYEKLAELNLAHRDIKPHNYIIYNEDDFVKMQIKMSDYDSMCNLPHKYDKEDLLQCSTQIIPEFAHTRAYLSPELHDLIVV